MKTLTIIFLISILSSLLACHKEINSFTEEIHLRSEVFSPDKRQALLPNNLFVALADKKDQKTLEKILEENSSYLYSLNVDGDTPLAIAIKFYNLEGALFVARQMSLEHYFHQNQKKESYIYLASQKAYVELIRFLGLRLYENKHNEFWADFEFSDLDQETAEGERALHVAKNGLTAEVLGEEYWRGTLEVPGRAFQYFQNHKEQTFLHTAIRDANSDLLRWGVNQHCGQKAKWEEDKGFFSVQTLKSILRGAKTTWRGIQIYGKGWADWDDLLNTQDHKERTAINFSSQKLFLKGIDILTSCQWINYLLPDNKGNSPLQNFLLALDPLKSQHHEDVYNTFIKLMESRTRMVWDGIRDHINFVNNKRENSLHISARLADPFFYKSLKKYGDTQSYNEDNQTPEMIFNQTRKRIKSLN